ILHPFDACPHRGLGRADGARDLAECAAPVVLELPQNRAVEVVETLRGHGPDSSDGGSRHLAMTRGSAHVHAIHHPGSKKTIIRAGIYLLCHAMRSDTVPTRTRCEAFSPRQSGVPKLIPALRSPQQPENPMTAHDAFAD